MPPPAEQRSRLAHAKQWLSSFFSRRLRINSSIFRDRQFAPRDWLGFWLPASPDPSWWGTIWDRDRDPVLSALSLVAAAGIQTGHHTVINSVEPRVLVDLLDEALKDHSNRLGTSRSGVLLLLQDVSSTTGLLPHRLRLASVPNLKYRRHGGEASIWIGTMGDQEVVSRQTKPPSDGDWESEEGQAILKAVVRQVIIMRYISHPNVVPLLGTTTDAQHPLSLISPHYRRGDALLFMKKLDPLKRPSALLHICISIASALHYLHSQTPQIIHGDVHEGNIVIDDEAKALLIDFGVSRIKREVTRLGTGITAGGSLRYLAPELGFAYLHGHAFRTSAASDCYAFAMTILGLITLMDPFFEHKIDYPAMCAAVKGERPTRPTEMDNLPPNVAEALWALMTDMWEHRPGDRPSLDLVQQRLEVMASQLPLA